MLWFIVVTNLIFKSGTRFWSKFVASRQHDIFLETKTKVCYMDKSLSLSIVEFSTPKLPPCSHCRFKKKQQQSSSIWPLLSRLSTDSIFIDVFSPFPAYLQIYPGMAHQTWNCFKAGKKSSRIEVVKSTANRIRICESALSQRLQRSYWRKIFAIYLITLSSASPGPDPLILGVGVNYITLINAILH